MNRTSRPEGQDLGERVEEYGRNSRLFLLLAGLGLACLLGGLFLRSALGVVGGLVLLVPAAIRLGLQLVLPRVRVFLHERGFVHVEGSRVRSFSWEEIDGVDLTETAHTDSQGRTLSYSHSFLVRARGGRQVLLEDTVISGGEQLGRTIMREAQHARLKDLLKEALRLEAAGEWDSALTAFEDLLRQSPYNQIADQAREHIDRLRQLPTRAGEDGGGPADRPPDSGSFTGAPESPRS